jgi:hypothetical protein
MAQGNGVQLDAERSHVLRELVSELGGLAHNDMSASELDRVLDNMLSKGVPSVISDDMKRWIHTHRQGKTKVAQILGAHVNKVASIIPECFGKYHDATAPECRVCLDRTMCSMKSKSGVTHGLVHIKTAYKTGVKPDVISQVLTQKSGQMAKHLARGAKIVLVMNNTTLRLLSVDGAQPVKETITMPKGKPAVEEVEEEVEETAELEDTDLDLEEAGEEEVEEAGEEEEAAPKGKAKPAAEVKVKKEKKPKAPKNKAQQDFQDALDKLTGADKQKYSLQVAKKLGVKWEDKGDERINHMLRCMAINAKLKAAGTPAAAAAPAKKAVVKK